jgi:hypothetical protein
MARRVKRPVGLFCTNLRFACPEKQRAEEGSSALGHEKAGQAELRCGRFSKTRDANQWEALRSVRS